MYGAIYEFSLYVKLHFLIIEAGEKKIEKTLLTTEIDGHKLKGIKNVCCCIKLHFLPYCEFKYTN